MPVESRKNTSDMTTRCSRQKTTDALLLGALLASACLAVYTIAVLKRA